MIPAGMTEEKNKAKCIEIDDINCISLWRAFSQFSSGSEHYRKEREAFEMDIDSKSEHSGLSRS